MEQIRSVVDEEDGVTGAEKALITLVGLGLILFVVKIIQSGAKTGANTASSALSGQKTGAPAQF